MADHPTAGLPTSAEGPPQEGTGTAPPTVHADPVPLRVDPHGVIRVGDTRIYLDLIVREYEKGTSPEAIVAGYDTLALADVYAAIAYYLRHREEVKAYMRRREQAADELERKIRAKMPTPSSVKEKVRAYREQRKQGHAPPAE
jgi:uncharacterized protein (DUF433 family)